MNERQERILELCNTNTFIYLKDLSEVFPAVSQMTLRRDIEALANEGLLIKIRGGARRTNALYQEDAFAKRAAENQEHKTALANAAIEYINDGSLIFMDSGSTIDWLARLMNDRDITVYTTGTNIAAVLCQKKHVSVHLTGGKLNGKNLSLSGSAAVNSLKHVNFDTVFMVASGYAPGSEFSCGNQNEADLKRYVISKASRVIMLIDETKVSKSMYHTFCTPEDVDVIVTTKMFPTDFKKHIRSINKNVVFNVRKKDRRRDTDED